MDSRGLDFQDLSGITPEEIETFRNSYRTEDGSMQSGFDFLIDHNPAALKTYRYYASYVQPPFRDPRHQASVFGGIAYVALLDFDEGVRYCIVPPLRAGFTREQIMEGMSIVFLAGGTRSLVTVNRALKDFDWAQNADGALEWPEGWTADPAAFASGLDFSTSEVLPGEVDKVVDWYERTIEWVPTWVKYFARYNQPALKGWRYRYEKALVTLPKQVMPMSLLFAGARLEQPETIRENVLLARAFGVPREDVLQAIGVTAVYGTSKVATAHEAAADIFDSWD
jgi:alkylhydroperoxidase/carboxymuconolactone decarboxylase family protein YurZ